MNKIEIEIEIENIINRKLLDDENFIYQNHSFVTYRIIDEDIIEIHMGYNKERTSYSEMLSFLEQIKKDFFQKKISYSLVVFLKEDNILVRRIIKKFGFVYHGKISIIRTDGLKRPVLKYFLSREH